MFFPPFQIEIFSLQVSLSQIRIDLFGMHDLDFALVLSIVNAVVSYLVIMIQFDTKDS